MKTEISIILSLSMISFVAISVAMFTPKKHEVVETIAIQMDYPSLPFCRDTYQIRVDVEAWLGDMYHRPRGEIEKEIMREAIQEVPGEDCRLIEEEYPALATGIYLNDHPHDIMFDSTPQ